MTTLVGIGHRSGHGKDRTADFMVRYINNNSGLRAEKISWARALKNISEKLYGHLGLRNWLYYDTDEGRELRNVPLPKINLTPVEIWVMVGQKMREIYDATWIDLVKQNATADIIILPDTRHFNEVNICDFVIKVHNKRVPNRVGKSIDDILKDYKDWDFILHNSGTLDALKEKSESVAQQILETINASQSR